MLNEALLRVLAGWHGLQGRLAHEDGQTLAEYVLITGVISVAVVVLALTLFRNAIVNVFSPVAQCVTGTCNNGGFP